MSVFVWIGFILFVILMLLLDLFLLQKDAHEIKFKEALALSIFWIVLALLFNAGIYYFRDAKKAMEFFAGYLIEKSLSVDNLFVFLALFSFFQVEKKYQHRILLWGIIGALIMRGIFIFLGVALIQKFHAIIYVFGAILIYSGIKLASNHNKRVEPEKNPVIRLFKRFFPVSLDHKGGHFFIKENSRIVATPLFIVLLAIESTDLIFAVDSIPAVLAISRDPFIVFTSNVFAILGLRALYFVLANILGLFRYLHYGLAAILCFVGVKMMITDVFHIPVAWALSAVGILLIISIVLSVLIPKES